MTTHHLQHFHMCFIDWSDVFDILIFTFQSLKSTLKYQPLPYYIVKLHFKTLKLHSITLFELLNMMEVFHREVIFQIFLRVTQLTRKG